MATPKKKRGQILLIVALLVVLILISSEMYIVEIGKGSGDEQMVSLEDYGMAIELGSEHVVLGSLANITMGGVNDFLALNLGRWSSFVANQEDTGHSALIYTAANEPYAEGVWVFWGTEGFGVSSACVDFNYTITKGDTVWNRSFTINQTAAVTVESSYQTVNETTKQTTATIQVTRNGAPEAAQVSLQFDQNGTWLLPTDANNYTLVDYGNGTYAASFLTAASDASSILVEVITSDGVRVQASAVSIQAP
jgi:hypothetical protein